MQKIKKIILTRSVGCYINALSLWNPERATLLAYRLFSNPRDGKLFRDKMPLVLKNVPAETIAVGDDHFEMYKWEGNNTVTLLIHGWESNASRWEKLLPHLKKAGNTIIAIDAPAHGLSGGKEFNVPKYALFIDTVVRKYQPRHIIGHSIGGIASVYYQHHYANDSIQKMVLLGAPSDFRILIDNYVKMLGLSKNICEFLIRHTKAKFNIDVDAFSGRIFLESSSIPGLIAHDRHDEIVAFSEGQKLASGWKTATFIATEGLGHSMHDDALYQKIIAFLTQS